MSESSIPKVSFDTYTLRARLVPALLVALPAVLAVLAWVPDALTSWRPVVTLLVTSGGLAFLSQIARDRGKRQEPALFAAWGGKPTVRMLRHRDAANKVLLGLRHKKLQELIPGVSVPTAEEERADPLRADQVYDACAAFLLEKTRDRQRFPLVFEENCNYGFRRNLWGMKPLGITLAATAAGAVAVLVIGNSFLWHAPLSSLAVAAGGVSLPFLTVWLFWLTPDWVKVAAEAYAERLLAACEHL